MRGSGFRARRSPIPQFAWSRHMKHLLRGGALVALLAIFAPALAQSPDTASASTSNGPAPAAQEKAAAHDAGAANWVQPRPKRHARRHYWSTSSMDAVDVAPSVAMGISQVLTQAIRLFAVGFLVLFMELACIRWFATCVIFLQFFTNVILIASLLGMSCGCLAAGRRQEWLHYFPLIGLGAIVAALATSAVYHFWSGLVIDVGSQRSAQEVFFGTEYGNPDVAKFVVPIEAVAAVFFVLVALMFVGLGQVMGRAFDAYPNRVLGYTLNIGGSLAGIVAFSALAFLKA